MRNVLKFVFGFGLIILIVAIFFQTNKNSTSSIFNAKVYTVNSGYGYKITMNDKLLIKQDYIPAIPKNIPFCNEEDANTIADLVISKLENKIAPTITVEELEKNNIDLNCLN
ncbi:DUF4907 domain-containing protein [uncultured Formosa sp.]|uniref:DUF4907 domain-containing protein n=1 Tax=uncultured Formosa sp. TaxID=255435 RepID=UPI00262B32EE|nr:DUF4907 domain-containing protein [uncultured Formosa sp.]